MIIKTTDVICIFGKRGTGKSVLARKLAAKIPCYVVFDPLHEHASLGYTTKTINQDLLNKYKRLVFQPSNAEEEAKTFFEACNKLYNCMIIIDEADIVADTYTINDSLLKIVRYGRHQGLGLICVCRRTQELNSKIIAQAHHIFSFRQSRPQDIDYLEKFLGSEYAEKLRNLKEFEYAV